jgi:Protein of unknown function (DUF2530)
VTPRPRRPEPEPLEVDDVKVVAIGTAAWLAVLLGVLALRGRLAAETSEAWVWTCLAGFGLGLLGLVYCRRRREAIRRDAARARAERQAPPVEPLT